MTKLLDAATLSIELGGRTPELFEELLALVSAAERASVRSALALRPYWTPRELRIVEACIYCLSLRTEMDDAEAVKFAANRYKFTDDLIREYAIKGHRSKINQRLNYLGVFRRHIKICGETENDAT